MRMLIKQAENNAFIFQFGIKFVSKYSTSCELLAFDGF